MSIILPNLNHSFVPVPVPVPVPDSGFRFRFRILDFLVFHTPENLGTSDLSRCFKTSRAERGLVPFSDQFVQNVLQKTTFFWVIVDSLQEKTVFEQVS